jgi:hypothetical protein
MSSAQVLISDVLAFFGGFMCAYAYFWVRDYVSPEDADEEEEEEEEEETATEDEVPSSPYREAAGRVEATPAPVVKPPQGVLISARDKKGYACCPACNHETKGVQLPDNEGVYCGPLQRQDGCEIGHHHNHFVCRFCQCKFIAWTMTQKVI